MANKFVTRTGLVSLETSHITGSLFVSGIVSASNLSGSFYGNGNQLFFGEEQQTADVRYLRNVDFNTFTNSFEAFSASVDSSLDIHDGRLTDLESFSASLDNTFATELEVSGYVEEISTSFESTIDTLSSSLDGRLDYLEGTFSQSVDTRLDSLEQSSSVIDLRVSSSDDGTNTLLDLSSNDALIFNGTSNEVNVTVGEDSITIGLTDDVTIAGRLSATNAGNSDGTTTFTGSFIGSFDGDGSNLTNITVANATTYTASFGPSGAGKNYSIAGPDGNGDYYINVQHNLDTENIIAEFFDASKFNLSLSYQVIDRDNIKLSLGAVSDAEGYLVIAKAGHLVTGSFDWGQLINIPVDIFYTGSNDTDDITEGATNLFYTDERVKTKLDAEGVISGSEQVDITQTTGYNTFSQSIDTTTDALDTRVTDLESWSSSLDNTFATEAEVSGYVEAISTSIENTTDALDTRVTDLESFSASLDNTYATEAEVSGYVEAISTSIEATTDGLDGRINDLETTFSSSVDARLDDLELFSSSLDNTYATEAEVSGYVEAISTSIESTTDGLDSRINDLETTFSTSVDGRLDEIETTFSTSVDGRLDIIETTFSASVDTRLDDLESFSASLDNTYATEAEVSGYVEAISTSIEATTDALDSRINDIETTFSTSVDGRLDDLESFSASLDNTYATEAEVSGYVEAISTSIEATTDGLDSRINDLETTFSTSVDVRLDDLESFSASLDNTYATELEVSGYVEAISTSIEATTDGLDSRINDLETTFSTSVDSRLDEIETTFSTSVDTRLDDLESFSASLDNTYATEAEVSGYVEAISTSIEATTDALDSRINDIETTFSTSVDARLDEIETTFSTSVDTRLDDLESFSASLDNTYATELEVSGYVEAISTSIEATTDALDSRINDIETTFSNSVDARLDEIETTFSTSVDGRLDDLESFSASLDNTYATELEVSGYVEAISTSIEATTDALDSRISDIETTFSTSVDGRLDYIETTFSTSVDTRLDALETSSSVIDLRVSSSDDGTNTLLDLSNNDVLTFSGTSNEVDVTIGSDTVTVGLVDNVVITTSITAPTVSGSTGTFDGNLTVGGTAEVTGRISSDNIGNVDGTTNFTGSINGIEVVSFSSSVDSRLDVLEAEFNAEAPASTTVTGANQTIRTVAKSTYDAMYFDYVVKDGTDMRAGTVIAVWDANDNVEFFDNSTQDLGNTADAGLEVIIDGTNVVLRTDSGTTDTWTIKTTPRGL